LQGRWGAVDFVAKNHANQTKKKKLTMLQSKQISRYLASHSIEIKSAILFRAM
jgi:hypothetical protein